MSGLDKKEETNPEKINDSPSQKNSWHDAMEFDPSVQSRWKISLACAGVGWFFALGLPLVWRASGWSYANLGLALWPFGFGLLFAGLSLLARERRRVAAWITLGLNSLVPGFFVITFLWLSLHR